MTTVSRQPLAPRVLHQLPLSTVPHVPTKLQLTPNLKRARSPDPHAYHALHEINAVKRHRTQSAATKENIPDKEKRRAEREALKEEFRIKYTRAFPSWTFYFDIPDAERDVLAPRILYLNGHIAKFFSNEVTHFITNRTIPESFVEHNKENVTRSFLNGGVKSPIKLKGIPDEVLTTGYETLVRKAKQFGMKIWDTNKLDSVLSRCCVPTLLSNINSQAPRTLTSLLESEKRYGTTTERDPTQRRHDYHYFSKGCYFVLVEDARQELATIAALEYPVSRVGDGKERGSWPVPHCHPRSRGPFIEYNEKEERRREKQEQMEKERAERRQADLKKLKMKQTRFRKQSDLRRTVSMNNLHKTQKDTFDCFPSASHNDDASGFDSTATVALPSYVAASGNSISLTSTFGTTSTIGYGSSTLSGLTTGASSLRLGLRGRFPNEVLTSRRLTEKERTRSASMSKASASSAMMPPPDIPTRRQTLLRKSKSTNTLRLAKRNEKSKPGYCESCRQKFEDFKDHIGGRRHQKFANTAANFIQLDYALNRVRRRTRMEVEKVELELESRRQNVTSSTLKTALGKGLTLLGYKRRGSVPLTIPTGSRKCIGLDGY